MKEPRWLTRAMVEAFHAEQLRLFGGPAGLRDVGMLESALGRPKNRFFYEGADIPDLAASYAFGIARNHPFVDGNKRAAFLGAYVFLGLNGIDFEAPNAEVFVMTQRLAAGEVDEEGYATWIRDRIADPSSDT
jgi:death-on-curing protein